MEHLTRCAVRSTKGAKTHARTMCACEFTKIAQPQEPRAGFNVARLRRQFLLLAGVDGRFTFQTKEL